MPARTTEGKYTAAFFTEDSFSRDRKKQIISRENRVMIPNPGFRIACILLGDENNTESTDAMKKRTTTLSYGRFSQTSFFVIKNSNADNKSKSKAPKKRKYILPVRKYSCVKGRKNKGNNPMITYNTILLIRVISMVSSFIE